MPASSIVTRTLLGPQSARSPGGLALARCVVTVVLLAGVAHSAPADPPVGQTAYEKGQSLYDAGRLEEAITAFESAAELGYRPGGSLYNVACLHSMQNDAPKAVSSIEAAIAAGFTRLENLLDDTDLDSIRETRVFRELLERLRKTHPSLSYEVTTDRTDDPLQAAFVYDDMHTFVRAHAMLGAETDTVAVLRTHYLEKGSPGLRLYIEKYDLTAERLARALRRYPGAYEAIDEMTTWLPDKESDYRDAFAELKRYIPHASFPPTFFLVGAHRGIGSGSIAGQLISVEKASTNEDKDYRPLLVHEVTHFQQVLAVGFEEYRKIFNREKTLLAVTLREGIAEFFTDLVIGRYTQEKARAYVLEREPELFAAFRQEMHGRETGDWMWRTPADPDQPRHVAYVMGARVASAYYTRSDDKARAVRVLLSVTDGEGVLEQSGYAP